MFARKILLAILTAMTLAGCSSQALYNVVMFGNAYVEAKNKREGRLYTQKKLMLFGGHNNKVYLGCLSNSEYATDSIFNEYGLHGSTYAVNGIWNTISIYGSDYSQYSPWNSYASDPPVIVDQEGNFYGYFTVNEFFPNRTRVDWIIQILAEGEKLER